MAGSLGVVAGSLGSAAGFLGSFAGSLGSAAGFLGSAPPVQKAISFEEEKHDREGGKERLTSLLRLSSGLLRLSRRLLGLRRLLRRGRGLSAACAENGQLRRGEIVAWVGPTSFLGLRSGLLRFSGRLLGLSGGLLGFGGRLLGLGRLLGRGGRRATACTEGNQPRRGMRVAREEEREGLTSFFRLGSGLLRLSSRLLGLSGGFLGLGGGLLGLGSGRLGLSAACAGGINQLETG